MQVRQDEVTEAGPLISIVIPVLNERDTLCRHLPWLQPLRGDEHEIILVDGGSTDGGPGEVEDLVDQSITAPAGRAWQMNAGAAVARGDVLLFLHIDTVLPEDAAEQILSALRIPGAEWGRFDVRLTGQRPVFRCIERMINWRSRWSGIATGDQAIFVRRRVFHELGGYPGIPLMEDVALSRRLRRRTRPCCLSIPVLTSSRRWERNGVLRTVLLMWWLRLLYRLGVSPRRLHRLYYGTPPARAAESKES
ncbi:MAG: TIGR04283 family arsenosugar biosynthesis glycosyltransferase [Pseudohongiellaceae bacterium]